MTKRTIIIQKKRSHKTYHTSSSHETAQLAMRFSKVLRGGSVVALSGELGAGKTVFTNGIAQSLGIIRPVTSPTFVLMMLYPIPKTHHVNAAQLCHIDTYRLHSGEELIDIGAQDYIGQPDVITVIEWPEKVADLLPPETIHIYIE